MAGAAYLQLGHRASLISSGWVLLIKQMSMAEKVLILFNHKIDWFLVIACVFLKQKDNITVFLRSY